MFLGIGSDSPSLNSRIPRIDCLEGLYQYVTIMINKYIEIFVGIMYFEFILN